MATEMKEENDQTENEVLELIDYDSLRGFSLNEKLFLLFLLIFVFCCFSFIEIIKTRQMCGCS